MYDGLEAGRVRGEVNSTLRGARLHAYNCMYVPVHICRRWYIYTGWKADEQEGTPTGHGKIV